MYRCVLVWVKVLVCHCVCLYTCLVILYLRTIVFHLYSFSLYVTFCLAKFPSHSLCSFLSQMLLIPTDFFWILVKPKFQIYFYKRNIDNVCVYMILLCFWQCVRVSYCLYVSFCAYMSLYVCVFVCAFVHFFVFELFEQLCVVYINVCERFIDYLIISCVCLID